jgi:N-acetylglucosaminyldiphosphoundecaprenol N-acetyl-beta-D-mannosaminyltransferase
MDSEVIAASGSTNDSPRRICLMGIPLDNLTLSEAVRAIVQATEGDRPRRVCFVNADCVNLARRHADYRETLRTADLAFADGIGMRLAGIVLGRPIRDNVNGTDLFPRLCEALQGRGTRIFLLGAQPGTAERLATWMVGQYPGLVVAGCRDGYFPPADERDVIQQVRRSRSDLLLVAFGAPRQDVWIDHHLSELGVKGAIGVGGLFDFFSGRIPRAPLWLRRVGLEWCYRLYQEPRRLARRYLLGNPLFLVRVLCERIAGRNPGDGNRAGGN